MSEGSSVTLERTGMLLRVLTILTLACLPACDRTTPASEFAIKHVDRSVDGQSAYPLATDPNKVGTYPVDTKSGAGYFYDEVLEYRVWLHPENGAAPLNGTHDYVAAFAQYEAAKAFSKQTAGAEEPLVLVRQLEWINEPERGHFFAEEGNRITEWQVPWLANSKRTRQSIREFLKHPREAGP